MSLQYELLKFKKECYEQGEKIGIMIAKKRIICGMHENGLSIPDIADVVNFTVEEVEEIISSSTDNSDKNNNLK